MDTFAIKRRVSIIFSGWPASFVFVVICLVISPEIQIIPRKIFQATCESFKPFSLNRLNAKGLVDLSLKNICLVTRTNKEMPGNQMWMGFL